MNFWVPFGSSTTTFAFTSSPRSKFFNFDFCDGNFRFFVFLYFTFSWTIHTCFVEKELWFPQQKIEETKFLLDLLEIAHSVWRPCRFTFVVFLAVFFMHNMRHPSLAYQRFFSYFEEGFDSYTCVSGWVTSRESLGSWLSRSLSFTFSSTKNVFKHARKRIKTPFPSIKTGISILLGKNGRWKEELKNIRVPTFPHHPSVLSMSESFYFPL